MTTTNDVDLQIKLKRNSPVITNGAVFLYFQNLNFKARFAYRGRLEMESVTSRRACRASP